MASRMVRRGRNEALVDRVFSLGSEELAGNLKVTPVTDCLGR